MTALQPAQDRPDWKTLGPNWPNAAYSSFVRAANLLWHCQRAGPVGAQPVLLVHGTGASSHSFAASFAMLAKHHDVLAIDLPGHGFTQSAPAAQLSLPGMAKAVSALLAEMDFTPAIAVGHSAGAAVLLHMAQAKLCTPNKIIGINAALKPIEGNALLGPLAKMLFVNPLTPRIFALQARYTQTASNLLAATNSTINDEARACYRALMSNPAHVNGALGMMANWNLVPLIDALGTLRCDVRLVVARDDKMVPPQVSRDAARRMPHAKIIAYDSGGHLVHEVTPACIIDAIEDRTPVNTNKPRHDIQQKQVMP